MSKMSLAAIGGTGLMLGPAADHLTNAGTHAPAQFTTLFDRGTPGEDRETLRQQWRDHGSTLTADYDHLLTPGDQPVDGVILCVGKNADDAAVLQQVLPRLARHPHAGHDDPAKRPFLLQLSTISSGFAQTVSNACRQRGIAYGNYPLTGGPAGAQAASMLILCSGDEPLFQRVEPLLKILGNPRYFGPSPTAAAEVKLIGHYMVFGGLTGLASAAALQRQCLPESDPVEFFDFLNNGAGGTKQWEVALRKGLADDRWDTGFFCRHGVIDTLYAAKLGIEKNLPLPVTLTMLQMALLLGRALKADPNAATHAIYHQLQPNAQPETDAYLRQHLADLNPTAILQRTLADLPPEIRQTANLEETLALPDR